MFAEKLFSRIDIVNGVKSKMFLIFYKRALHKRIIEFDGKSHLFSCRSVYKHITALEVLFYVSAITLNGSLEASHSIVNYNV